MKTDRITKNKKGITLIALIITIIVMLILVGVTVNVALNGGLFSTAKRAASGMQMAQIREKAEVVKATLIAEAQSNNSIIVSKTEYKNRLLQEFEESTAVGSKVVVEDSKYDIIIKNADLEIEVVEHSDSTDPASLIDLGYTTSNIEEDGKIYVINVSLNIQRTMTEEEYIALKKEQETEVATDETKKQEFLKYCYEYFGAEEPFTSIDEAMLYNINYSWGYGPFETLEEALQDETLQADWGTTGGITKEQSYYFLLNDLGYYPEVETESMTEQEVINYYYEEEKNNIYRGEYYKYTQNLSVYIENDGTQELIKDKVNLVASSTTINYAIVKNGRYDFIVKTRDGEEITREIMQINNVVTPNPYVLTLEEAEGIWTTDGKGTITKYTGTDTDIVIPVLIGTEYISKIKGGAFEGKFRVTSVKMSDAITEIMSARSGYSDGAFARCSSLKNIELSNNLTTIGDYAFYESGLEKVEIPERVISIGNYAFSLSRRLKNVLISNSVTRMGSNAFYNCESLTEVVLSENLINIPYGAFQNCNSLIRISIPKAVKRIEGNAFYGCHALKEVIFEGEQVSSIGRAVFGVCRALTSITIPNSVSNMDTNLFYLSTNLTTINFAPGSNPIPSGQPWGATNATVTKLTE